MPLDWNKVIEQSLSNAPAIIGAIGLAYWRLSKKQDKAIENQNRIEAKVNGNHKQAMRAIKAAGKYEGFKEGRGQAIEDATKIVKTASKRGPRRATDKQ